MNYPTTTAEYRQVTVTLEPQACLIFAVLPGQTARPIRLADERPAAEYANLSERDLGLIEALLTQAKREIDAIREQSARPCPACGLVDDHKGGCPESGTAPQPGAPG